MSCSLLRAPLVRVTCRLAVSPYKSLAGNFVAVVKPTSVPDVTSSSVTRRLIADSASELCRIGPDETKKSGRRLASQPSEDTF